MAWKLSRGLRSPTLLRLSRENGCGGVARLAGYCSYETLLAYSSEEATVAKLSSLAGSAATLSSAAISSAAHGLSIRDCCLFPLQYLYSLLSFVEICLHDSAFHCALLLLYSVQWLSDHCSALNGYISLCGCCVALWPVTAYFVRTVHLQKAAWCHFLQSGSAACRVPWPHTSPAILRPLWRLIGSCRGLGEGVQRLTCHDLPGSDANISQRRVGRLHSGLTYCCWALLSFIISFLTHSFCRVTLSSFVASCYCIPSLILVESVSG